MMKFIPSLRIFVISVLTVCISSLSSPFSIWHINIIGILLIYSVWRHPHITEQIPWLLSLLWVSYGSGQALGLQYLPLLVTYSLATLFSFFFRRFYVESYLVETLHAAAVLLLSLVLQHLALSVRAEPGSFCIDWFWIRLYQLLPTLIATFILFIALDRLLGRFGDPA